MPLETKPEIVTESLSSDKEILEYVRDSRREDLDSDQENRERGLEDTRYAGGYQWPESDYEWRRENDIPALTFNNVPSLLRHRLGARARKRVSPRITPETVGKDYEAIASIREGLIRNIERNSDIRSIDAIVSQQQLISGISNYEIAVEFANADVFENDIKIKADVNPWSVIWDKLAFDSTGRDARRVIKETYVSKDDFKKLYPDAEAVDIGEDPVTTFSFAGSTTSNRTSLGDWISSETVRVATAWLMSERPRTLAMLTNGDVIDITGQNVDDVAIEDGVGGFHTVVRNPGTNAPVVRESPVKFARGYVTNGKEILKEPFELPIDRVPLIRVPGWTLFTGERVERFGMVSFAKDALTFFNYVKSDRIERIVYRNRAQYEAQEDALLPEQLEAYRNSHRLRGGVLQYRGPRPDQVEPPRVDQAAIIETEAAQNSILDIFDIRPGLAGQGGITPPSGVSLERQENITDTGGIIFDDLQVAAKKEYYRVINQLIDTVYDTPRIIKVVGRDDKIKEAIINDPETPESKDITLGKYAVEADIGPAHDTQRDRAINLYETMFNSNPELMGLVAPELIELLNIPGAEKLVNALRERSGIPVDPEDMTEEQIAAQQQQQALEQQIAEMEMQSKQLDLAKQQAEVDAKIADAESKRAVAASEIAQMEERRAQAQANIAESAIKQAEADKKIELIQAQIEKIFAEIRRANAQEQNVNREGD